MKPLALLLSLLFLWTSVLAQEEEEGGAEEGGCGCGAEETPAEKPREGPAPDPARVLTDLTMANVVKDVSKIDFVCKDIIEVARTSKNQEVIDAIVRELQTSLKICKGNWGTLGRIVDALGELRTKDGAKVLKKIAGEKNPEEGDEEMLTAKAVLALAMMGDTRNMKLIEDQMKSRSVKVAKAAYEGMKHYADAKGRDRKKVVEALMKRIEAEYPSQGQGGNVSEEQRARWNEVSPVIVASLQAVTHQPTINDLENWREWWKENKRNAKTWKDKEDA